MAPGMVVLQHARPPAQAGRGGDVEDHVGVGEYEPAGGEAVLCPCAALAQQLAAVFVGYRVGVGQGAEPVPVYVDGPRAAPRGGGLAGLAYPVRVVGGAVAGAGMTAQRAGRARRRRVFAEGRGAATG